MSTSAVDIDQLAVNTIRTLSMDAVQAANSGHPGTPMALAPVAYAVWRKHLRYDPERPLWPGRDRFVLSCGHASMLLYSTLHLAGVKQCDAEGEPTGGLAVPLDHIKAFRQWESRCPGHPEYGETTGVETTTGPLGQGIANSVGMAAAAQHLAATLNRPGFDLFGGDVYVLCSDGDLMEGIGCEAASLAGHLKLANLCWIYDDNHITIEGDTELAFSEDVGRRFEGLGWRVERVADANDLDALDGALDAFHGEAERPTLIIVRSEIGYGAPNAAGTSGAHGSPLGEDEIRLAKAAYGWPEDAKFLVPEEAAAHFRKEVGERGAKLRAEWEAKFAKYVESHPDAAAEWNLIAAGELPEGWDSEIPVFPADPKGDASRNSGGKVLNAIAAKVPWLVGGSADLAPSTKTLIKGAESFEAGAWGGRNFHFGIREHAMAAAVNGMALYGLRSYGATFFVFSDYCRPSIRLAGLMGLPSIFVFTHDSIGVGEDGPTHQPVEQLAACRAIPNVLVIRPGDANEVAYAWRAAMLQSSRPTCLVLSRQNLPTLDRDEFAPAEGTLRGGYVAADIGGDPQVILLATGSELSLAVSAARQLASDGVAARVVSMPCFELFDEQDAAYRESVLPASIAARVAVEAGVVQGWEKYLGPGGRFVGLDRYGASAPAETVYEKLGITADHVVAAAKAALASS